MTLYRRKVTQKSRKAQLRREKISHQNLGKKSNDSSRICWTYFLSSQWENSYSSICHWRHGWT